MYVVDDASSPSESGYTTPPLSPSKTVSTEGWSSPRTPGSPRKSRSCLLFQQADHEAESPFCTSPPTPTKSKFVARLGTLSIPEILTPTCKTASSDLADDSPSKRYITSFNHLHLRRSLDSARSASHSLPSRTNDIEAVKPFTLPPLRSSRTTQTSMNGRRQTRSYRSSSEDSIDTLVAKYTTPPATPIDQETRIERNIDELSNDLGYTPKLGCLPFRVSSSPLRPSQWVSRGGFLSTPRKPRVSTPDRFIHCRRPPGVVRDSFELNRPEQREQIFRYGQRAGVDPFSRRVRRSGRLDGELQGLREAHVGVTGRSGRLDRNPNPRLRGSSFGTATRQISAGAIWNVGGSSAVSGTVAAVSTGNGGMLGSGTNAPLYTSTFLDRADPEAELQVYERRLALALEIDQTERVLQHSSITLSPPTTRPRNGSPFKPHFWRDSTWSQDGVISSCWCSICVDRLQRTRC